ncbi:MAG: phage Gp37/Gp68 family protein [Chloroflexi bacterium]|nr:phage Gp37/Gp68 family protein [Chloroflexota bacterium]
MPGKSSIEWTDRSWNPTTGCFERSPGCAHCYAKTFAERWRGIPGHAYEQGFDLRLWPERLEIPLRWRKPCRIFVNSMSDLFLEDIPEEFIAQVFDVMARAHWHTFQVLTKRHERLVELAPRLPWPPNVWMGVSIENRRFVHRADYLRQVPAAVRFASVEPMLGPVVAHLTSDADYGSMWWDRRGNLVNLDEPGLILDDIHWVIAGGESGPRHRPMCEEWVRDLRDACLSTTCTCAGENPTCALCGGLGHRTAFFYKQRGGFRAKDGGRELDGRTWDEFPVAHPSGLLVPG